VIKEERLSVDDFAAGDWVIYTKQKVSQSPGRRAQEVSPAEKGDTYSYVVDKYWIVAEVQADGKLMLKTRRGKQHVVEPDDPMLRKASWWERILYASRFSFAKSGDDA
jgi:hypothetical protein